MLPEQDGDWYGASRTGFDAMSRYRVVIRAEDDDGLEARPLTIKVRRGWAVELPLVLQSKRMGGRRCETR